MITIPVASQQQAEAGIDDDVAMTPLKTALAIAALAPPSQNMTAGRLLLTSAPVITFSPTGDNATGDGSAQSPFLTAAYAYWWAQQRYDLGGLMPGLILKHAGGIFTDATGGVQNTFDGPIPGHRGPGSVLIHGGDNPSLYRVNSEAVGAIPFFGRHGAYFRVSGMTIGSVNGTAITATFGSDVEAMGNYYDLSRWSLHATGAAQLTEIGGSYYLFTSGALGWAIAEDIGRVSMRGLLTMSGAPSWTNSFVQADLAGIIEATGFIYVGNGTGKRANALPMSVVFTGGTGQQTHFPGHQDGTISPTGYFN